MAIRTMRPKGQFKSERREAARNKERRGMQVTNTSIRLLAKLAVQPLDKGEKMGSDRRNHASKAK